MIECNQSHIHATLHSYNLAFNVIWVLSSFLLECQTWKTDWQTRKPTVGHSWPSVGHEWPTVSQGRLTVGPSRRPLGQSGNFKPRLRDIWTRMTEGSTRMTDSRTLGGQWPKVRGHLVIFGGLWTNIGLLCPKVGLRDMTLYVVSLQM
jgi:hypothetical protein